MNSNDYENLLREGSSAQKSGLIIYILSITTLIIGIVYSNIIFIFGSSLLQLAGYIRFKFNTLGAFIEFVKTYCQFNENGYLHVIFMYPMIFLLHYIIFYIFS